MPFAFVYDKRKKMKIGLYPCSDRLIWAEITVGAQSVSCDITSEKVVIAFPVV